MAFRINRRRYKKNLRKRRIGGTTLVRKRARRSVTRNRNKVSLGQGFPKKLTMTHKYVETVSIITGGTGALVTYSWSANSLYDPNSSGVGHQPMYFDQLTALYNHYVVIGSKCKVKVTPYNNTQPPAIIGCFLNDDSTVTPTTTGLLENSKVKWRQIAPNDVRTHYFNMGWSAKKTFGGSILANTELQGTASASPVEQSLFTMFLDSTNPVGAAASFLVTVELTYISVWKELKDVATS